MCFSFNNAANREAFLQSTGGSLETALANWPALASQLTGEEASTAEAVVATVGGPAN